MCVSISTCTHRGCLCLCVCLSNCVYAVYVCFYLCVYTQGGVLCVCVCVCNCVCLCVCFYLCMYMHGGVCACVTMCAVYVFLSLCIHALTHKLVQACLALASIPVALTPSQLGPSVFSYHEHRLPRCSLTPDSPTCSGCVPVPATPLHPHTHSKHLPFLKKHC